MTPSPVNAPAPAPDDAEAHLKRRDLGADEEVVRRILLGEVDLYEVIMRRHNLSLYRVARSILRDDAEAEDVMQQAYVNAYLHLPEFRGEAGFFTWLTRIAVHESLARLRRRKRDASLEDEAGVEEEVMSTHDRSPEQRAHDGELRVVLDRAIDALPVAYRTVFVLRSVEDLSTTDTAAVLGIREETVKTRLHRARGLLQQTLARQIEAGTRDAFSFERTRCDRVVRAVLDRLHAGAKL